MLRLEQKGANIFREKIQGKHLAIRLLSLAGGWLESVNFANPLNHSASQLNNYMCFLLPHFPSSHRLTPVSFVHFLSPARPWATPEPSRVVPPSRYCASWAVPVSHDLCIFLSSAVTRRCLVCLPPAVGPAFAASNLLRTENPDCHAC